MSGHAIDDLFAVELQHDAECAVRGRVVRAEVQEHVVVIVGRAAHAPFFGLEAQRFLLLILPQRIELERIELGRARRIFLAQRMAVPRRRQQDAPQMRMPVERDAEQIPHFAFVPVRVQEDRHDRFDRREIAAQRDFDADVFVAFDRQQVIDHREIGRRQAFAVFANALVHGRQIEQHPIRPRDLVLQVAQHFVHALRRAPTASATRSAVACATRPASAKRANRSRRTGCDGIAEVAGTALTRHPGCAGSSALDAQRA